MTCLLIPLILPILSIWSFLLSAASSSGFLALTFLTLCRLASGSLMSFSRSSKSSKSSSGLLSLFRPYCSSISPKPTSSFLCLLTFFFFSGSLPLCWESAESWRVGLTGISAGWAGSIS